MYSICLYAPSRSHLLSFDVLALGLGFGRNIIMYYLNDNFVFLFFFVLSFRLFAHWSAGCQLVALNWQTFGESTSFFSCVAMSMGLTGHLLYVDLGYMINHSMFQRNGRAGYVLKPLALRSPDKHLLTKRTKHYLDIKIISAQQLPRVKDSLGREIIDKSVLDPFVEVSIHIPDWTHSPFLPSTTSTSSASSTPSASDTTPNPKYSPASTGSMTSATSARTLTVKTGAVKNNGFNPVWEQAMSLPFDCVGDMRDLIFVRFAVKQEDKDDDEPLAVYCVSLGSLNLGEYDLFCCLC